MASKVWTLGLMSAVLAICFAAADAGRQAGENAVFAALGLGEHTYVAIAVGSQLVLGAIAIWRYRIRPAFGLAVPAETIVAFGIFSLVIGLAAGLYRPLTQGLDLSALTLEALWPICLPFIHGLIAAAFAPLIAMLLRNYEAGAVADAGTGSQAQDIADANRKLAEELTIAQATVARLNRELKSASDEFGRGMQDAAKSADALAKAIQKSAKAIGGKTEGLASTFQTFDRSVKDMTGDAEAAAKAIAQLKQAAEESRTLLDAFATLIESVENFLGQNDSRAP